MMVMIRTMNAITINGPSRPRATRTHRAQIARPSVLFASFVTVLVSAGCEKPNPTGADSGDRQTSPNTQPTWVTELEGEPVIAADLSNDPDMKEAIAEARRTAESARKEWRDTPVADRPRWAVKWAAKTRDGSLEYVWVRPMHWSPFRIEGRLLSRPRHELIEAVDFGDLVAFPVEELVDWVKQPAEPGAPRKGGFTIDVLEQRFGSPSPNGRNTGSGEPGR
jgi:uncharacterized protein YegJ (DUF2314 family)